MNKDLRKNFGTRIKELRTKKKLTQFQLAEKVGIDAKHLSHIETGRSFPKETLIENFASELDIEIPELFNFSYIKSSNEIITEIINLLNNLPEQDLQKIYKIITAYLK